MAAEARPVLGVLEDVQHVPLGHARLGFPLERGQARRLPGGRELLQVRCAVGIEAEFGVAGKPGVHLGGERRQLRPQRSREILAPFGDAECRTVGGQPRLALGPWQELGAVVGKRLGALDMDVAHLQRTRQVNEHAHLQRAPVEGGGSRTVARGDKSLPALGREAEIKVVARHLVAARMPVLAHHGQRPEKAAVLGRRAQIQQVEQPEQQDAVPGMDGPQQRQVVAAVPGRHRPALAGQRFDAAPLRQKLPDFAPERGVARERVVRGRGGCRPFVPRHLQHLAENADQALLDLAVLVVQVGQPLLGQGLGPPDAAQQHLDQLVPAARARLAQQGQQQGVPPGGLGDVEHVAHLQRRGLGGELPQLGVGDPVQQRCGIDQPAQPLHALGPQADGPGRRRPRRLLQAVEAGRDTAVWLDQEGVQHRGLPGPEADGHLIIDACMHLGADAACQPVKGAEGGQVDAGRLQGLHRAVDQVGRVAHRLGGREHRIRNQVRGCAVVRCRGQVSPDGGLVAVQRLGPAHPVRCRGRRGPELEREVRHGAEMQLGRWREQAEVLPYLEQRRQQQASHGAAGDGVDEGQV